MGPHKIHERAKALINDLPPLPPDAQDECDDEDIDDERERE